MKGRCLCGAVAFEIEGTPTPIEICHCSRCRRAYGGAFAATFYVRRAQLRWTAGEDRVRIYDAPILREPPAYRHAFCGDCGAPLPIVKDGLDVAEIPAGLIAGDPGVRPLRHIHTRVRVPWLPITDDLPQCEEAAPLADNLIVKLLE